LLAGCLTALGLPAQAGTLYAKFYTGGSGYIGPFSGVGTVYDATKSLSTNCPVVGTCSDDNIATTLTFTTIKASSPPSGAKVWGDFSPNFGGLGVQGSSGDGDDQIDVGDVLKIHFDSKVVLKGVGTLFDAGHTPFNGGTSVSGGIVTGLTG